MFQDSLRRERESGMEWLGYLWIVVVTTRRCLGGTPWYSSAEQCFHSSPRALECSCACLACHLAFPVRAESHNTVRLYLLLLQRHVDHLENYKSTGEDQWDSSPHDASLLSDSLVVSSCEWQEHSSPESEFG